MPKKKSKKIDQFTPPEKPYHVIVKYNQHEKEVRAIKPNDEWDSGEQEIFFTIESVHATEPEYGWPQSVEVSFNPEDHLEENMYVIVVRYDTGDTFGNTYNTWKIPEVVLTMAEADKICKAIKYDKYDGYVSWKGYFEHFNSVDYEVHMLRI
jgi:hypothetical protein